MARQWNERNRKIAEVILKHRGDDNKYHFKAVKQELPDVAKSTISTIAKDLKENNWLIPETGGNGNKQISGTGAGTKSSELRTKETTETTYVEFVQKVQTLPMTPDLFMGYMCAVKHGFKGDLGQWIATASRDFWIGRGINPYEEVSLIARLPGQEGG